ncbi:uncharacterized protein K452DRAFT_360627 [Aplosporella prunicola CBS 121167]|uniref:Lysophospholipase n=1 Tax=Aplosporella prunicola CBS 121167 TaxID=1176127 RepID=A0A6A6B5V4_9PEZI|nr:uncharacterized protein K452DRAFT_360627 [Aplosporella prunicola CBS 121167]KAF2139400.1 hypothetical protein K452DRAFT_360627 [Aplosporella prunicola CBS 121167]
MRFATSLASLATASSLFSSVSAGIVIPRDLTKEEAAAIAVAAPLDVLKRATAQAPDFYVPKDVGCPSDKPTIRRANGLSDHEKSWLETRRNNTVDPMRKLLTRMNIEGFDVDSFFKAHSNNASALPNIGIAISGGGYRALMNGAGAIAAFDERTTNSTGAGHLGGLLQSATYLAGLSGGGWLVGSLFTNNFTSVQNILGTDPDVSGSLWQFGNSIFKGPEEGGFQILNTAQYYDHIYDRVQDKNNAGFETTITDYWGRALSYQLVNASEGGPAYTFSSIQDDPDFKSGNTPMPLLVADGRAPGETVISSNATNYEFNPWEMGSFDPTVFGFAPMRYVGSDFDGGVISSNGSCVRGFDNVGYVMGTSSTLFNQFLLRLHDYSIPDVLSSVLTNVLEDIGEDNDDIASWRPNPFYHYNNDTNPNAMTERLTLVDGGEDYQNIPFSPLIQPARDVDVIFAIDSSADTSEPGANWPNGTALVATYERSLNASQANGTIFPSIPDQNTFVNLGLNNRPTFFGCDISNYSSSTPLVVYLPNTPYVYHSNVSTFTDSYNNSERNAIIENGYDIATRGNGTVDQQWPVCVGCAILSRSLNKTNTAVPEVCNSCFERYCWNGTRDSSEPKAYDPEVLLTEIRIKNAAGERLAPSLVVLGMAMGAYFAMMV